MDFNEKDFGFSLPCLQKLLQNNPTEELIQCFNFNKKKQLYMETNVDKTSKIFKKQSANINFQNSRTFKKPEKNQNAAMTALLYSGLKMDRAKTYKKPLKTQCKMEETVPLRSTARNPSYLAAIEDTSPIKRHLRDASTSTHDLDSHRPTDPQSWKRLNILHLFGSECELEINTLHKAENQSKYRNTPESESYSSSSGLGSEYSKIADRNYSVQKLKINEDDEENADYSHIYYAEDWHCHQDTPSVLKTTPSSAFELTSNESEDWDIYDYTDDESSESSDYSVYFADRPLNRSLSLQDLCHSKKSPSKKCHDFSHRWSLEALPSHSFVVLEENEDCVEYYRSVIDEQSYQSTIRDDEGSVDIEKMKNGCCNRMVLEQSIENKNCKSPKKYKSKEIVASKAHLRLSIYVNSGLLTIHVISARKIEGNQFDTCNSYVKVMLHPKQEKRIPWHTNVVMNTNTPIFDEKFSFELLNSDLNRRLLISMWNCDSTLQHTEFLGCMSFGITHVIKKQVNGWYRLLIEEIGERKHFASSKKSKQKIER